MAQQSQKMANAFAPFTLLPYTLNEHRMSHPSISFSIDFTRFHARTGQIIVLSSLPGLDVDFDSDSHSHTTMSSMSMLVARNPFHRRHNRHALASELNAFALASILATINYWYYGR